MTTMPPGKIGRRALWFLPAVSVIVGFFAALPWLKQQDDSFVLIVGSAAAIFVMGYSHFISYKLHRGLDEVQIASTGFASSRGWVWGAMATVLLLMLPPVTNWLTDLANTLSAGAPDRTDRGSVQLALFFGLTLVVFLQSVCICIATLIWWRRMGGMREQS